MTTERQKEFDRLRDAVYEALLACEMTAGELAEKLGATSRDVSNQISRLRKAGMAQTSGRYRSKAPVWRAVRIERREQEIGFVPQPLDRRAFGAAVRGTPWQGMERLV